MYVSLYIFVITKKKKHYFMRGSCPLQHKKEIYSTRSEKIMFSFLVIN